MQARQAAIELFKDRDALAQLGRELVELAQCMPDGPHDYWDSHARETHFVGDGCTPAHRAVDLLQCADCGLSLDSDLGLSSSIWTSDPAEQAHAIADLEAGAVFINGMSVSYPELPFGGIKNSGHGRELAALGIKEFCNAKKVWLSARARAPVTAIRS